MAAQLSLVLNDVETISDDERRKNRDFAVCKKILSKRDFQRHYVSKHRKGFHPRFFCRACSLVFACNYSFRVHWTKKHEHLVKKNLDERMNYAGEKDCEATKKKLELRDAVVWSRNGSSICRYGGSRPIFCFFIFEFLLSLHIVNRVPVNCLFLNRLRVNIVQLDCSRSSTRSFWSE